MQLTNLKTQFQPDKDSIQKRLKVIIPIGGYGTRLRPHTYSKPKPLIEVAGKPVLAHILDKFVEDCSKLKQNGYETEIIFVIGPFYEMITNFIKQNYTGKLNFKFLSQKEMKGQSWTVKLAQPLIHDNDSVIIWFVDTISDAHLYDILSLDENVDAMMYVKEVDDPRRFGQVVVKESENKKIIVKLAEKADPPLSNLVNIGIYYVKRADTLFRAIEKQITLDIKKKNEYYLVDALNIMLEQGKKFVALDVAIWIDCGTREALLEANRILLKHHPSYIDKNVELVNSVIIEPVFINANASIHNSVIGPYVSISKNVVIKDSRITDTIIHENSVLESANLKESLIGSDVYFRGIVKKINIGDHSDVRL